MEPQLQRSAHRIWILAILLSLCFCGCLHQVEAQSFPGREQVEIDVNAKSAPFPHFWEEMFGSGRANLMLRESWRDDLRAVKQVTDLSYVRGHGILDDENGIYTEDEHGNPVYNFQYVDQIYDGLLKAGVRPIVEISFMPRKLAFNPDALHAFWYKPNVSPPKSWERWDGLITHLAQHLVDRYGVDEVSKWYFEVWNEPNIDFWGGIPRQDSYFELYAHTARDIKGVSSRLRVGGPATAAAQWVPEFLKYTSENHVPVDFVSTHGYADDTVWNLFHTHEEIPMDDRVCRAIGMVKKQIQASSMPSLPLLWTEWNVPGHDAIRDTTFVGPALANTVRECDGLVTMMSFWTFSDVFEEGGPIAQPFEGNFGLIAEGGIKKASYYDFSLLHKLGDERLANSSRDAIVTRRSDGSLAIAVWNLVDPQEGGLVKGSPKEIVLKLTGLPAGATAAVSRVDDEHGNTLGLYRKTGSPQYPTVKQVDSLNQESALPPPQERRIENEQLELKLEPNALLLVEIKK
ncbi:GH39 family glycosyl hydrolase [Paracidobacterium acidisoli]|uniref:Glycosyl hydrolase family 39 n=1 Tax=Paracidobacterium acidisoli TaxID=2303751 RepID=A0A372IRC3_9BACT|nr:glycosyl hydrolase family 39 [Paracidobacterium acidisoli]MBT9330176.1 glycosyl hydrolase family 39 [Paracidobacterium acidisoli]